MRERRENPRSKLRWLIYAALMCLLVLGIYAVTRSGFFSIKAVSCRVDGGRECSAEIMAELNQYIGKNLLFIRKVEIEDRIISADRLAREVKVNLRLPATLGVEIFFRKAAAAITLAESIGEAVEVDSEGVILRKTENPGELPKLVWSGISNWPIEQRLPENIVRGLTLTSLAGEKFQLEGMASIDSGDSVPATMLIRLKSGEKVRLSLDKEPVELLTRLQLVLNRVRIEGKSVREIDLRFDRPIVR